jgi:DNA-directed RNA polymerase specialized sigma24 family protein
MGELERRLRLESLFAGHADDVLAYARRRVDFATADDMLSEVFVGLLPFPRRRSARSSSRY